MLRNFNFSTQKTKKCFFCDHKEIIRFNYYNKHVFQAYQNVSSPLIVCGIVATSQIQIKSQMYKLLYIEETQGFLIFPNRRLSNKLKSNKRSDYICI